MCSCVISAVLNEGSVSVRVCSCMISAVLQADVCTQEGALRLFDIATGQPGGVQHVVASLGGLWKASISHLHCCVCPFVCQSVRPLTHHPSTRHQFTPTSISTHHVHPHTSIHPSTLSILPSAHPTHPIDSSSIHPLPPTELFYHPFVHSPIYPPTPISSPPPTHHLPTVFIYPPIQTLILPIHLFIQTPTLSIHSPTHTHPYMYPFIHPPHQFIYPTTPIQLLIHPSVHPLHLSIYSPTHTNSFTHLPYPFTNPPTPIQSFTP